MYSRLPRFLGYVRRVLFTTVVVGQLALLAVLAFAGTTYRLAETDSTSVPSATRAWVPPTVAEHPYDPSSGPPALRLAVAGDVGTGDAAEWATAELMAAAEADTEFDALLLLGDNAYPHGSPDLLDETVFDPFAAVLDGDTSLYGVLGNHDVENDNAAGHAAALGMPARWYAVDLGDALVVVLDSTQPGSQVQLAFLNDALEATDAQWKIVALHHPLYSAGSHGSELTARAAFEDIFVLHGVDLVLSGHDHDYQRTHPIDGVTYVVSGGAARLRPTGSAAFTAFAESAFHFVTLDVWPDAIVVSAHTRTGVLDRTVLGAG